MAAMRVWRAACHDFHGPFSVREVSDANEGLGHRGCIGTVPSLILSSTPHPIAPYAELSPELPGGLSLGDVAQTFTPERCELLANYTFLRPRRLHVFIHRFREKKGVPPSRSPGLHTYSSPRPLDSGPRASSCPPGHYLHSHGDSSSLLPVWAQVSKVSWHGDYCGTQSQDPGS